MNISSHVQDHKSCVSDLVSLLWFGQDVTSLRYVEIKEVGVSFKCVLIMWFNHVVTSHQAS